MSATAHPQPSIADRSTGSIWCALRDSAARRGDATALITPTTAVSYRQLAADVEHLACRLLGLDIRSGDHVALAAGNTYRWIVAYFAIARVGATSVLINTRWGIEEMRRSLRLTGIQHVLFEPKVRTKEIGKTLQSILDKPGDGTRQDWQLLCLSDDGPLSIPPDALPPTESDRKELDRRTAKIRGVDLAEMVFTSGSTAYPKAAMLRHGGLIRNAYDYSTRLELTENDRWCSGVPFFHIGGSLWGLMGCIVRGATLVFLEAFDAEHALWTINQHRCTVHFAVATMMHDELRHPRFESFDLSSLRICSAGAPRELRQEVRRRYAVPTILSMWGMTESHGNVCATGPSDSIWAQDNTFGSPHPGSTVSVADPTTHEELAPGTEGELLVDGDCVFEGYYGDAEATRAAIDDQGRLHTGDLGTVTSEGYVLFNGRLGDKIRVGGENVALAEIEAVLNAHPGVEQSYAIGVPDSRLEEVPVAFVRVRPGTDLDRNGLLGLCAHLADFKRPHELYFVDDFPRGAAGRVSKSELKRLAIEITVDKANESM